MNPKSIVTCLLKHSLIKSAEIFLNNNNGIRGHGVRKKFMSPEDSLHDHFENYTDFNHPISLLYLDSYDVDWLDPLPSMIHGLREFLAIYPVLSRDSIILIDDSPKNDQIMKKVCPEYLRHFNNIYSTYGFFLGKGALVLNYLNKFATGKLIAHDYQIVWRL